MKQIIILLLMLGFFVTGFAQKPGVPCCTVIAIGPKPAGPPCCAIVTTRDNATGRTFEFTVDNSVAKNYTVGTAINAQPSAGIIKSVNGTVSKYVISEPDYGQPYGSIISIEPDGLCCSLVSAKANNLPPDGVRFSFSVPKSIAANLEIGQKVSIQHFEPVDGDKVGPVYNLPPDGYAVVQSSVGALPGRKLATYSFHLKLQSDKHEVSMAMPVDNGYESIRIFARIAGDEEMEVKVNGRIVATYTQDVSVNLDGFLKRNAMNVISFKFSAEAKNSNVELNGKFPGNTDENKFFNFNPKAGKTEAQFEVPFTGKTNKRPAGYDVKNDKAEKHEVDNSVPVDNGYESIKIFARISGDEELEVKVNGRIVATYTQTASVNLDGFLKRNAMNVISFKFSAEAKNSNVELSGKFPGNDDGNTIFNFTPKAGKTEGQFEVPFTGKKR